MSTASATRRVKAVLLAGGLGSRLRPLTDTTPKCLVEIAGKPLLDYWFAALREAGVEDVLINTHHLPQPVREFLARKSAQGFRCVESYEPKLLGSAGTIAANAHWADDAEDIVIVYADNLSDIDIRKLLHAHRSHGQPMTMLLFRAPNPRACGIAELNADGNVVAFEEKPAEPKSDLANAGVYVFTAAAWSEAASMQAFDIGFDVLPRFVGRMQGHVHTGYHRDIGDMAALEAAREQAPRVFPQNRHHTESTQR